MFFIELRFYDESTNIFGIYALSKYVESFFCVFLRRFISRELQFLFVLTSERCERCGSQEGRIVTSGLRPVLLVLLRCVVSECAKSEFTTKFLRF